MCKRSIDIHILSTTNINLPDVRDCSQHNVVPLHRNVFLSYFEFYILNITVQEYLQNSSTQLI